jgi:hypothetical protein
MIELFLEAPMELQILFLYFIVFATWTFIKS